MKFSISYFYNVRNLKPNQVPISTAVYDPKWFHRKWWRYNYGEGSVFNDNNNVINGIRCEWLNPKSCHAEGCPCKEKNYKECRFLHDYRKNLLELDFDALMNGFERLERKLSKGKYEIEFVLMVYEKPDNPCSERQPLIELFRSHGIEMNELIISKGNKKLF